MNAHVIVLLDQPLDLQIVFVGRDKVQIPGIHQHNRDRSILPEIVQIALLDIIQIIGSDVLLILAAALGDIAEQSLGFIVEVDESSGLGR